MRQRASANVEVIAPEACPGLRAGSGHYAMVAGLKAKVFLEEKLKVLAPLEGKKRSQPAPPASRSLLIRAGR
jgi:hypothetical protein